MLIDIVFVVVVVVVIAMVAMLVLSGVWLWVCWGDYCRSADGVGPSELQQLQAARVDQLVVYLGALLRRYVEGDVAGFKVSQVVLPA